MLGGSSPSLLKQKNRTPFSRQTAGMPHLLREPEVAGGAGKWRRGQIRRRRALGNDRNSGRLPFTP
jgi:hypothetical protein